MLKDRLITLALAALLMVVSIDTMADDDLNRDMINGIISYYDLDPVRVEIEFRKNRIKAEPGDYDSLEINPMSNSEPRGLIPLKVTLYKNGDEVKSGQIRIRISWFENALVTTDKIRRHDIIMPNKYQLKRVETTYLTEKIVNSPAQLAECWAKKNIGKDQILTSGLIEVIPAVVSGKEVSIMYRTQAMEITARGTALEAGYIGESIRVRNSQSRKIIACTIIDRETVQVNTH